MRTRWMFAATVPFALAAMSSCAAGVTSPGLTGGAGGSGGATSSTSTTSSAGGAAASSSSSSSSSAAASSSSTGGPDLCGNGTKDPGEQCDGSDFGGLTCEALGLGPGQLVCNAYCSIVATGCQPKEDCQNGQDDNANGLIDCQDPDCDGVSACIDSCTPPASATIPAYLYNDITGRPAAHKASCSVSSGNEIIYQVTTPADGTLSLTLSSWTGADLTLSIRSACAADDSEIACANLVGPGGFDPEVLSLDVLAGQTYFVMVDGNTPQDAGQFDLQIDMPLPESDCSNLFDDDFDGYLDCDDATSCQTLPECTPGAAAAGQPCFFQTECAANHDDPICLQDFQGFPGGYCSEFCDQAADDCGPNAVCDASYNLSVHGVCLQACTADADCRAGYACVDKGLAKKVCTLAPESDCNNYMDDDADGLIDCQDPSSCQSSPACTPGTKATGQPCTQHNECFANQNDPVCLDALNIGFPGGYCSQFCTMSPDDCGPSAVCTFEGPNGTNVCMQACTTAAQCRAGYACLDFGYPKMICYP